MARRAHGRAKRRGKDAAERRPAKRKRPAMAAPVGPERSAVRDLYAQHVDAMAFRSAERSRSGRDIGAIPKPLDQDRRDAAGRSLRVFMETYGRAAFSCPWSDDHLAFIQDVEQVVRTGGTRAKGFPRGFGKTAILEWATLWAGLYLLRRYPVFVGASNELAESSINSIKTVLECNELLAGDFPEVCIPVRAIEGRAAKCKGQLCQGQRTRIEWQPRKIILPHGATIGRPAVIIEAKSMEGAIRGMRFTDTDGTVIRPDLSVIDDPQTRESAKSKTQCHERELIIEADVMFLAGPDVEMAAFMGCTVVEPGDLADRFLDRRQKPAWHGVRGKTLLAMPKDLDLWDEFGRILLGEMAEGGKGERAKAHYLEHRERMDEGCVHSWPHRVRPGFASAIHQAMATYYANPSGFHAEMQNEPLRPEQAAGTVAIDAGKVAARLNGVPRGVVPAWATRLTAFIDIQQAVLFWLVAAWDDVFTGAVVDYGAFPEQSGDYWTLPNARRTLQKAYPTAGLEGQLQAGLAVTVDSLTSRAWKRDGAGEQRIDRLMIDANWDKSTAAVYQVCRASTSSAILLPSRGQGIGASKSPMRDWKILPGERAGPGWRVRVDASRGIRSIKYDTNHWKGHVADALNKAEGDKGAITLWGKVAQAHRMLADHLAAEEPVRTEALGRVVDEWRLKRVAADNHWFDCLVGCAVAASERGASVAVRAKPKAPRRVSLRELQAKARGRR